MDNIIKGEPIIHGNMTWDIIFDGVIVNNYLIPEGYRFLEYGSKLSDLIDKSLGRPLCGYIFEHLIGEKIGEYTYRVYSVEDWREKKIDGILNEEKGN